MYKKVLIKCKVESNIILYMFDMMRKKYANRKSVAENKFAHTYT